MYQIQYLRVSIPCAKMELTQNYLNQPSPLSFSIYAARKIKWLRLLFPLPLKELQIHLIAKQVEQLQIEMKPIQCFFKDADNRQDPDERVRNLASEIRDVAYESEDVIDTFLLLPARTGTRESVSRFINRLAFIFTEVNYLHEIGTRIKSIQAKIGSISASVQTYGIRVCGT
ncbi:putative disease resistance protein At1g50180 isoform X2 [Jatropha curcas]|uniref:putative disease resistance protein At1g50180 isoform X2 n=1 Tax=Jatropha curcas TaxID=180498 RepID=UPI0009D6E3B7|nr:putative disease resistance protein At1g50180 isoform X2 [Jatropha curcas]